MAATGGRAPIFEAELPAGPLEAFDERLSGRLEVERVREQGFRPWALLVPEPRGPLDLRRFAYQGVLYSDRVFTAREAIVKKASQVGMSAWSARWALCWADVRGRTALYVFPNKTVLNDFSDQRIKTMIRRSEYLRSRMRADSVDNKGLKQVGLGWVYFRGSESEVSLESIPADVLVLDEYDRLVGSNIGVAEQRVTGPGSEGLIRRLGNPTIPGYGIAKLYEASTQHVWMVKCGACNEQQPLVGSETYTANMDEEAHKLVCRKCRKALDVTAGEWVAAFPDRETLGFWISKFVVPGVDLRRVVTNHHKTHPADIQNHYNRDLGEEYAPAEGRLSRKALEACCRPGEIYLQADCASFNLKTMGVDVATARACNVRISEHFDEHRKKALWIGTVDASDAPDERWVQAMADRLQAMAERYEVNMVAIDHLPEGRLARALAARLAGRCYLVAYSTAKSPTKLWDVDDEESKVVVHRTFAIDATLDMFRAQRNLIPALEELPDDYADHMGALVRIVERDEKDKVVVFYRSTGPDDFAQAEVYDLVATELFHHVRGVQQLREAEHQAVPTRDPDEVEGAVLDDELTDDDRLEEGGWDPGREWE